MARIPPVYTRASALLPDEARTKDVHKVHILGADERSRFVAHALSEVYDSVEIMRWQTPEKYNHLETRNSNRQMTSFEATPPQVSVWDGKDQSHIDHLLVGGAGHYAMQQLDSIKHRLDKNSTVCLMTDGFGVLEDVKRSIFNGTDDSPQFLLGNLSHNVVFNNRANSLKLLREGQMNVTIPNARTSMRWVKAETLNRKTQTRAHFMKALTMPQSLSARSTPWDSWFRAKLPTVLFDSIVEPVCVALDVSYAGLQNNPAARRMINQLCGEIARALRAMPDLQRCIGSKRLLDRDWITEFMHGTIRNKGAAPSRLAGMLKRGVATDADYLTGYFVGKGSAAGVDMRMTRMMWDMVKAREQISLERAEEYVPFDATTVPPEESRHVVLPRFAHQAPERKRWPHSNRPASE